MAEFGDIVSPVLELEYEGQREQIPFAEDATQLRELLGLRVMPVLAEYKTRHPMAEIAVTEYLCFTDLPLLEQDFFNTLDIGVVTASGETNQKEGVLYPDLRDRLSARKNKSRVEIGSKSSPFETKTFIISPMTPDIRQVLEKRGSVISTKPVGATSLLDGAVAVSGEVLMELMGKETGERVTNLDLVEAIGSLHPGLSQGSGLFANRT